MRMFRSYRSIIYPLAYENVQVPLFYNPPLAYENVQVPLSYNIPLAYENAQVDFRLPLSNTRFGIDPRFRFLAFTIKNQICGLPKMFDLGRQTTYLNTAIQADFTIQAGANIQADEDHSVINHRAS